MDLAAVVRAADALMSPLEWGSEHAWLSESLLRVGEACGGGRGGAPEGTVERLEALLRLPGDEPGWLDTALHSGSMPLRAAKEVPEGLLAVVTLRCALASGLATLHRFRACRITLGRAFDEVDTGLAIYGGDGVREIARNARLDALLVQEPERARLRELITRQAAHAAVPEGSPREECRDLELAGGSYRLTARRAAPGTLLPEPAVLVLVDRVSAALPTTQELRVGFGLRGREPQVALLAAEGLSNAAIAERLRLSSHTVRHYLERVLYRLGLHSRKALALHLMAGGGERRPPDRRRGSTSP